MTLEEAEKVSGGGFQFDSFYFVAKRRANIPCPVCGAEGTLDTVYQSWDGYSDGTRIAVDTSFCRNCGAQIAIFPELNEMATVDEHGNYSTETYPVYI